MSGPRVKTGQNAWLEVTGNGGPVFCWDVQGEETRGCCALIAEAAPECRILYVASSRI